MILDSDNKLLQQFHKLLHFYYGEISYQTLEHMIGYREEAITLEDITALSEELGFISQISLLKEIELDDHSLPALLFNEEDINSVHVIEKLPSQKYKEDYTHIFLLFKNPLEQNQITTKRTEKDWFWNTLKSHWRSYVEIGTLTIFINLFLLVVPMFTLNVYDRVVPNFAKETLAVLAIGVGLILLFDVIFKSVRIYIIESVGRKISNTLESELMRRMLLIQGGEDLMQGGAKANLFKELLGVKDFFAAKSIVHLLDFPFFLMLVYVIYLMSPTLAMVPLASAFIILLLNFVIQIPLANMSHQLFKDSETKHSYLYELIAGIESVKLFNAVPAKLVKWKQIVGFFSHLSLRIGLLSSFSQTLSMAIVQAVTLLVIIFGVYEIHENSLTIGALIAITILSGRAMVPVVQLSSAVMRFKEFKDSLDSIDRYWQLPLETEKKNELGLTKLKGEIEFRNVSFTYSNRELASLEDATFKINAKEKIGIIGQTGAGKSTLLRLMTALHAPNKGNIFIDGHDISQLHPVELRDHIGVLPQEPYLFSGSLADNIGIANAISKEKLMQLVEQTGLTDLIKKSAGNKGFDVGEGGAYLSVGQRQLVALARSLVNNPSILILDEPSAGLDVGLERELINQLKSLTQDKTLILITHRFAALELVDRILVVNDGKIVADGPRDTILKKLQRGA